MLILAFAACTSTPPEPPAPVAEPEPPAPPVAEGQGPFGIQLGMWEGRFASQGGPIRFRMEIGRGCETTLHAAGQTFPTHAECEASALSLRFPPYLGSLTAVIGPDGRTLRGQYDFQSNGEWHHLPFEAAPAGPPGFIEAPDGAPTAVSLEVEGRGAVLLELREGPDRTYGAISAPTGDWGPLEGGWTPDGLELSGFDGAHAFLVKLAPDEEGRLAGLVFSRDAPGRPLRETTAAADLDGWDALALDRVDLGSVSLPRAGFEVEPLPSDGPRIVHLTGTWCPNCNDAAPVIEALAKDFPEVAVLSLSWEAGAVPAKADRQIGYFRDRFAITHPIYRLDGMPPFLDPVPAWPTTLFLRADGTVAASHVGFLGPSTGERFTTLVERYRAEAASLAGR
ncbi:MAG: TlpA family protein disulfide reductase [Alphaproteobacteria bacterium]|nr:TlpA family protein disulfide reductase [Alphaproteobacteria bacterium]